VRADPARLQQVFWNLIKNAVKFTPAGGEIHVDCRVADDCWEVSVRDSGIGIERHVLPRIFEAFEQGADRINRQFGGLGMGLSISKALVELHGGTLTAHSEGLGRGATFTVSLPGVEKASPDSPPQVTPAPKIEQHSAPKIEQYSKPLRILLVEDHDATSHVLSLLLRQLHHTVTAAPTIAEARRRADQGSLRGSRIT
jgi:CheY-like chemotaxis protein